MSSNVFNPLEEIPSAAIASNISASSSISSMFFYLSVAILMPVRYESLKPNAKQVLLHAAKKAVSHDFISANRKMHQ